MTDFTVTITDPSALAGITAARNAYNTSLPIKMDDQKPPQPIVPTPGTLNTDGEYVQFVMEKAAESYAKSFGLVITAAEKTALQAKLANATVVG